MRLSDLMTIATSTPSLELMYRAAYGVYKASNWFGRIAIIVGAGNNGGDGFALACILHRHGLPSSVFTVSPHLSEDSSFYAAEANKLGVPIAEYFPGYLSNYDIIVDCLLGTGFQGDLRLQYKISIEEVNESYAYVISVDINCGMNGDTGSASVAVISDLTVTIGYVNRGLISHEAAQYIHRLVCIDIRIQLAYEEDHICSDLEWRFFCCQHGLNSDQRKAAINGTTYHRCPAHLSLHIIPSYEDV